MTERDFQTAMDYNEHTQRRVMHDVLSGFNPSITIPDYSAVVIEAINRSTGISRKLSKQLDAPIVAETYIEGKGGSKEANNLRSFCR